MHTAARGEVKQAGVLVPGSLVRHPREVVGCQSPARTNRMALTVVRLVSTENRHQPTQLFSCSLNGNWMTNLMPKVGISLTNPGFTQQSARILRSVVVSRVNAQGNVKMVRILAAHFAQAGLLLGTAHQFCR